MLKSFKSIIDFYLIFRKPCLYFLTLKYRFLNIILKNYQNFSKTTRKDCSTIFGLSNNQIFDYYLNDQTSDEEFIIMSDDEDNENQENYNYNRQIIKNNHETAIRNLDLILSKDFINQQQTTPQQQNFETTKQIQQSETKTNDSGFHRYFFVLKIKL